MIRGETYGELLTKMLGEKDAKAFLVFLRTLEEKNRITILEAIGQKLGDIIKGDIKVYINVDFDPRS